MAESRVLIIGGGAAGLAAAIAAARLGADVTLLEADDRVGRKILVSGNGRCNLSNVSITPAAFNRPEFVEPILDRYGYDEVRDFFAELGLLTAPDAEGRVYPTTNAANSVLDVLRLECAHLGVDVRCGLEAARVLEPPGGAGFVVSSRDGETMSAPAVVITSGGGSELLAGLGHRMVPATPVLAPIRTAADNIRGLSGVRVRCATTLYTDVDDDGAGGDAVATERGELLFRDYGVSGIMIFDLSRFLGERSALSIDLFPDVSLDALQAIIAARCERLSWRTAETFFAGMLHDRVARAVLRAAQVGANTPAEKLPFEVLSRLLKDFRLKVIGVGDPKQAQVTRGGASVEEFDPDSMESRRLAGLFAAGEMLDVDGRSGGYNLHWAWASGIVAGESAARLVLERAAHPDGSSAGAT